MVAQVLGVVRQAVVSPVSGCCRDHKRHRLQLAHDQIVISNAAHPQSNVDAFFNHVDHPIVQVQAQGDRGVLLHELAQQLRQPGLQQPVGCGDAQAPARFASVVLQLGARGINHLHQRRAALKQQVARIGQAHTAGAAVEQAHAEPGFEGGDVFADVGLGHIEDARGARETAALGNFLESADEFEGVHCFR